MNYIEEDNADLFASAGEIDHRPEKEIYLPSAAERAETEKQTNYKLMDQIITMCMPYLKYAQKYRLVCTNPQGQKVCPREITTVLVNEHPLKRHWTTFHTVLSHPKNVHLLMDELSTKENALLAYVAQNHYVPIAKAEEMLGKEMTLQTKGEFSWRVTTMLKPQYCIFYELTKAKGPIYASSYNKDAYLELNNSIRECVMSNIQQSLLLAPALETLPQSEELCTYNAEADLFVNIPILQSLYKSHKLLWGRSKVPAEVVKVVEKMCNLQEFFPKGDKNTANLCAYIVATFYTYFTLAKSTHTDDKAEDQAKVITAGMLTDFNLLVPALMKHVKGFRRNAMYEADCRFYIKNMLEVMKQFADGHWLGVDALTVRARTYDTYAEKTFLQFKLDLFEEMELNNTYTDQIIWPENLVKEFSIPLTKAYLFMMAAFGVVELAYSKQQPASAVSPYDNLQYVRLTELGRYALGIIQEYKVEAQKTQNFFELYESCLIIKSLSAQNPFLSIVASMAKAISQSMYKIDFESFLYDCTSAADIDNKISMFRSYVCANPPAVWEQFFEQVKKRSNPLTKVPTSYRILKISPDDKELQRILLTDPDIRKYITKAEGHIVLIEKLYYPRVCTLLKKRGYLQEL